MKHKYTAFYLTSLAVLLAASAYPLYMGVKTLAQYLQSGAVAAADYPKYIIPYAPMCLGILLAAALYPLLYGRLKRFALPAGSAFGIAVFLGSELFFEGIQVIEGANRMPLQSWQYSLCIATPEVLRSIGEPIYAADQPAFKVHFYIIAVIIILTVLGLIHGFTQMIREQDTSKRKPLFVQLGCAALFVGLCMLACFTAFFRNGTLRVGPLSAFLMCLFFVVFGVTFGVYLGTLLFGRRRAVSAVVPAAAAALTTGVMYAGELVLTGGRLFRFGEGFFFSALGPVAFAPCDLLVIFAAGAAAYGILRLVNRTGRCGRRTRVTTD